MSITGYVQPYVRTRVKTKIWSWLDKEWSKLSIDQKIRIAIAFLRQDSEEEKNPNELVIKVQHQDLEDRLACYSRN